MDGFGPEGLEMVGVVRDVRTYVSRIVGIILKTLAEAFFVLGAFGVDGAVDVAVAKWVQGFAGLGGGEEVGVGEVGGYFIQDNVR
jgi:hypothetical protein